MAYREQVDYFDDNPLVIFVLCQWNNNSDVRIAMYCPICKKVYANAKAKDQSWAGLIGHENTHLDDMGIDPEGKYGEREQLQKMKKLKKVAGDYVKSYRGDPKCDCCKRRLPLPTTDSYLETRFHKPSMYPHVDDVQDNVDQMEERKLAGDCY